MPNNHLSVSPQPEKAGFWLYGLHLWTVFGLAISNVFLGLSVLVTPWALRGKVIPWRQLSPILLPLALYTSFVMAATIFSYDFRVSLEEAGELLSLATLFLALLVVRGEESVRKIVDGLVIVAAVAAAFGLGQLLAGYGDIDHRIRGPFSHWMTFAGVLLQVDLLLVAQMVCGSAWRSRWRWLALIVINLALVGSLTRSAWVGLIVAVTVLVLLRAPRYLLAYVPAAVLFIILAPVPVVHRVLTIADFEDVSNYDRLCMAEAGLHMIAERPVYGIGPGMVDKLYPLYRHPTGFQRQTPHLHNSSLQIAAEKGLPAAAAYLWLVLGALTLSYKRYRQEERDHGGQADLFMGAFLALLAFSLAGIFEDNWSDTEVQRVALFLMAFPYCLPRVARVPATSAAPDAGE